MSGKARNMVVKVQREKNQNVVTTSNEFMTSAKINKTNISCKKYQCRKNRLCFLLKYLLNIK